MKHWVSLRNQWKINPNQSVAVDVVLGFFTSLVMQNLSYSIINICKSMLT